MKIDPIVDKRGRWRFKITNDEGKVVIPIPPSGYKTQDEALAAANAILNGRVEAHIKQAKNDLQSISGLKGKLAAANREAQKALDRAATAEGAKAFWVVFAAIGWLAAIGLLLYATVGG